MNKTAKPNYFGLGMFLLMLFNFSCSSELEVEKQRTNKNGKISFEQFKHETGLNDFKTKLKVPRNVDIMSRNADGSYEIEDFDINIDVIKKLVVNEKVTYTFLVMPKITKEKTFFNLTMYFANGKWETSIVEMKPTEQHWEDLKNGIKRKFDGEIKQVYRSVYVNVYGNGNCTTVVTVTLNCTNTGSCKETGVCDGCSQCMSYSSFTICELNSYLVL